MKIINFCLCESKSIPSKPCKLCLNTLAYKPCKFGPTIPGTNLEVGTQYVKLFELMYRERKLGIFRWQRELGFMERGKNQWHSILDES